MSTDFLYLIPDDPNYEPSSQQVQNAVSVLSLVWPAAGPEVKKYENVQFVDNGGNLEAIRCPRCNVKLDEGWWRDMMDSAWKTKFQDLSITCPACEFQTNLNDLKYDLPMGFARFRISISKPGNALDSQSLQRIEESLGCKLRKVWAHY